MPISSLMLLVLCLVGVTQYFRQSEDAGESPPEVTILKHGYSFEGDLSVRSSLFSAKVKNNTTKKITGVTWYFVLKKNSDEEYFRIRFISHTEIAGEKTKTLKGMLDRWPRGPLKAVSVDELRAGPPPPPQERILISCLLFSDGSFSSLKDSPIGDCQDLVSTEKVQKK